MAAAEAKLGLWPDEQHPVVRVQETCAKRMSHDGPSRRPEMIEAMPPVLPPVLAYPVFLEAQSKDLLGHDMTRLRRRPNRFHPALAPKQEQAGRVQQAALIQCEEQAVTLGPRPSAASPDALQERCHGGRRVDL